MQTETNNRPTMTHWLFAREGDETSEAIVLSNRGSVLRRLHLQPKKPRAASAPGPTSTCDEQSSIGRVHQALESWHFRSRTFHFEEPLQRYRSARAEASKAIEIARSRRRTPSGNGSSWRANKNGLENPNRQRYRTD